ncbi:MAG: outer membrane protein assembly factor BamD [Deltaproteobacteria bacterium]
MRSWIVFGLALGLAFAPGCSGQKRTRITGADELYAKGTMAHNDESHQQAILSYRTFLDHYPLDPRAEEVERRIADAYFEDEKYPEAIATYSDVQRMHPISGDQAEVELRIGQSYRLQMDTIDRDLASAQNAHEYFRNIALRYPGTEEARNARTRLKETREHLAARELYVAEFYADRDSYRAAAARAGEVVIRFPDTSVTRQAVALLDELAREENDTILVTLAQNALAEIDTNNAIEEESKRAQYAGPALGLLRMHLETMKLAPASPRDDAR